MGQRSGLGGCVVFRGGRAGVFTGRRIRCGGICTLAGRHFWRRRTRAATGGSGACAASFARFQILIDVSVQSIYSVVFQRAAFAGNALGRTLLNKHTQFVNK